MVPFVSTALNWGIIIVIIVLFSQSETQDCLWAAVVELAQWDSPALVSASQLSDQHLMQVCCPIITLELR